MEFAGDFHFLRPWALLALLPALLLFLLLRHLHKQQTAWNRAIEADLLPYLLDKKQTPKQNLPLYGMLLLWILSSLALAGPVWQQIPTPVQEREDALVVILDLSLSMYATDLSPNRLTRAQRKLRDVLSARDEGLTALVVYAGDAHAVTPLTDDVNTILNLVPALDPNIMPVPGSRPLLGLRQALDLLSNSAIEGAQLLLMTDGIEDEDLEAITDLLEGSGHSLSVLGIGTPEGAPIPIEGGGFLRDSSNAIVVPSLPRQLLQELAARSNGRYADARLTDEDMDYLLSEDIFEQNQNLVTTERQYDSWYETGPWLLLLVLPLAALAFRQGWLFSICLLALVLPPRHAMALDWQDLWLRQDQQAREVFEQEEYSQAARLFDNERWQAAAHYRTGEYEQAVETLALFDDARSHYNRGNALAHLMRYEEALAAYDAALARQPDMQDAQHNREIVAQLLEQQQNQQQQDSDQEGEENQQDNPQQQQNEQQQQQQQQQQGDQQQDQQNQDNQQQQQGEQQEDEQQQQEDEQAAEQEQENQQQNESEQQDQQLEPQQGQSRPNAEEEQAMQQWLRRIEDDPGELLRNKFQYQSQQRLLEQLRNPGLVDQQPEEQIW